MSKKNGFKLNKRNPIVKDLFTKKHSQKQLSPKR